MKQTQGTLAIVVASLLWGTTGTAASYAPQISPLAIGAFAMGFGGILLVLAAIKTLFRDFPRLLSQPKLVLFGGLSVAVYPLAFYTSMRFSGVAIGTVVSIASAPFFAAVLERLISKKVVSLQWLLSFIVGASGIVLLSVGKNAGDVKTPASALQTIGILLGLVAGLTYAGYSWAAKQLIECGVNAKSSMAGLFGLAATLLLPSLWFTGGNLFTNEVHISVAFYMAAVPMFIGYLLFGFGLKTVDASRATLITLIEPMVASLLAVYVIGEEFRLIGWIGMALVSLCLLMQSIEIDIRPNAALLALKERGERV